MLNYLKLDNKKRAITPRSEQYTSMDNMMNVGIILKDDVVLVDFDNDNKNEAKIISYLMEHFPTETVKTTRGTHFYYAKPDNLDLKNVSDTVTMGGFQVDYKTGGKNYAGVKLDGVVREGANELTLENLPVLPIVCWPMKKLKNVSGYTNGDGRNNALFYHLRCVREFSEEIDLEDIATFVNQVCFSEPMDEREVETTLDSVKSLEITREFKNMILLADLLVEKLDICHYKGRLYFKDGARYVNGKVELNKALNAVQRLKKSQFNELDFQIGVRARIIDESEDFKITLRNGVLVKDTVVPMEYGFTPFYLDVNYDPEAYDVTVDNFLDQITRGRSQLKTTLIEVLGHCLMTSGFPHKVFFLLGKGRNGKSTFLEMINSFAGNLSSSVGLSEFNDPTSLASMIGKIVNCSDDIDSERIDRTKFFKSISAGNTISIRPIYSDPILFRNTATLIVNANALPTFADKSIGLYERILIVPFDLDLRSSNIDPDLAVKLSTENAKSYLLNLAIEGKQRLTENGKMTPNTYTEKAMSKYKNETDSMSAFLDQYPIKDGDWLDETYKQYRGHCFKNDINSIEKNIFSRRLKSRGYEMSNVKRDSNRPTDYNRDRRIYTS